MQPENNVNTGQVPQNGVSQTPQNNVGAEIDAALKSVETPAQENAMMQGVSGGNPASGKKKGKGMVLGMICLGLLAVGGIGFGVWAMLDGNSQKESLNSQISDLKQQNNELLDQMNKASESEDVDTMIDANINTSAWNRFSSNLAKQSINVMGYYWHYNGTENEHFVAYAAKDSNGHLTITDAGNNMNSDNSVILELDDVLSVYYIKVGNGGVPYFYIVDINGDVNRIDISENSGRQLEKVGDYTKIVTILEAASLEAILVDIDGNLYKSF